MRAYVVACMSGFWKIETASGKVIAEGFRNDPKPLPPQYTESIAIAFETGRVVSLHISDEEARAAAQREAPLSIHAAQGGR